MKWQKGRPKTGGRAPGSQNRATRDIRAIAQGLIEDPQYQASLQGRLLKGTSPQLEVLLHYYAYGKPKTEITGDMALQITINRGSVPPIEAKVVNETQLIEAQADDRPELLDTQP